MKRRVGVITPIVVRPDLVKRAEEELGLTDVRVSEWGHAFIQGYKGKALRLYVEESDGKLRRIS